MSNPVLRVPPASPAVAAAHFATHLSLETDVSDVHAAMELDQPGFVLLDVRARSGWDSGHIPGALHLPTDDIPARTAGLEPDVPLVTYCWGPGCNGATRAALALALAGFQVKVMIGGIEYWVREGLPVRTGTGLVSSPADPLTVPSTLTGCQCTDTKGFTLP